MLIKIFYTSIITGFKVKVFKKITMTILFVADNIGGGGKERRMLELIKSLSKDPSYTIILISLTDMGVGYKYMYEFPITIIETDRRHRFTTKPYFIIKNAIKKYKPDIVHSWGSMGSLYMLPLLIFRKFKFINGIIADAPKKIHWYQKPYIRGQLTYPFSDVVLSNSLAGIKSYDAPVNKTFCIYNGIDMARFQNLRNSQELKKEIGIENFSYVVGMVGAFHDRKDYITFVEAAKKVISQQKDICFLLVGEGKNQQQIEDMVPAEDKKNILFLGRRADVEDLVQVFDVGVLCTNSEIHGEGVSNSLIEYMSLQKPVIATEGGGTNEVIEDTKNGFLIQHNGVDELAEKILYLYHHPENAKQMGEKALETINKKFLLGRMTDEFIAVYKGERINK